MELRILRDKSSICTIDRMIPCNTALGFSFFFQGKDGIRGAHGDGVQACALPNFLNYKKKLKFKHFLIFFSNLKSKKKNIVFLNFRSEKRRVGKECKSRWSPYHKKKKKEKFVNG